MARIVGGNPQGEFRGKLGGLVYSRNRSGQIARSYARPLNRNSAAQVKARAAFAQAIVAYHLLNPQQKLAWQIYGAQYFTSVNRGNLAGAHSGINAFVSLRNTLLNIQNNMDLGPGIDVNGVPVVGPIVQSPINFVNEAPNTPFMGKLANYGISNAELIGYSISTGVASIKLGLIQEGFIPGTGTAGASTSSILTDGHNNYVGVMAKISASAPQQNVFPTAQDGLILASSGLIEQYTTPSVISNEIVFNLHPGINTYSSKYMPQVAQSVFASVWLYNSKGEQMRIGGNWVQIST